MSIKDFIEKSKPYKNELFISLIIITVAFSSYGMGKLSAENKTEKSFSIVHSETNQDVEYVASARGSKYYLPWCEGAERILEKNKVFFDSKEEAEKAGYEPSKTCFE